MDEHLKSSEIERPDPTIGTPDQDAMAFPGQQEGPDTCAIRCQETIIREFTGIDPGEEALVREAGERGWYAPGDGTALADVGNLLELHGIPVHRYAEANVLHLASELGQGHKVIIGVDADDLWRDHPLLEELQRITGLDAANHAVLAIGLDTTDPDDVRVILSDPGTGEASASYPMVQFLDAWRDSDFFMVATDQTAPAWLPEMANFDYGLGHIAFLGGIDFDTVAGMADQPDAWDDWFGGETSAESDLSPVAPIDALDPYVPPAPPDLSPGGEHVDVISFGGYYNADESYHYTSDDSNDEPDDGDA